LINKSCVESQDLAAKKKSSFQSECKNFNTLLLAVVGPNPTVDVIKVLLAKDADQDLREETSGDNILHLCARYCAKIEILEYLLNSLKKVK